MKINLLFLAVLFLLACSSDDDNNGFPRKTDIEIMINASDTKRLTEIETLVYGTDLELRTNTSGNAHLPYNKMYLNQEIPELSSINVAFRDNSLVPIGAVFTPYTMEITVKIDGETAISEQHTIHQQGHVVSMELSLTEYFAHQ